MSSPVFAITTRLSGPTTSSIPRASFAPPVPPARTTTGPLAAGTSGQSRAAGSILPPGARSDLPGHAYGTARRRDADRRCVGATPAAASDRLRVADAGRAADHLERRSDAIVLTRRPGGPASLAVPAARTRRFRQRRRPALRAALRPRSPDPTARVRAHHNRRARAGAADQRGRGPGHRPPAQRHVLARERGAQLLRPALAGDQHAALARLRSRQAQSRRVPDAVSTRAHAGQAAHATAGGVRSDRPPVRVQRAEDPPADRADL